MTVLPAAPPIDLQISGCGVSRAMIDGVEAEVVTNGLNAGMGMTWSLSRFLTEGPDTLDVESDRSAGFVYTQVPVRGGFTAELACGAVYDARRAGLVRPRRSAARFRFSGRENHVFGVVASLEAIKAWFDGAVPKGLRPLLDDRDTTLHAPQVLPGYLHQSLRAVLQSRSPMRGHMIEAVALQILGVQLETLGAAAPGGPTLAELRLAKEVRTLLEGAPQDPPALSRLAVMLGCSAKRLDTAYRAVYGISIYQARQDLRFEAICAALRAGVPIGVVARRFGYPRLSNFSTAFRKRTGLAPRVWREQQVKGAARADVPARRTRPWTSGGD